MAMTGKSTGGEQQTSVSQVTAGGQPPARVTRQALGIAECAEVSNSKTSDVSGHLFVSLMYSTMTEALVVKVSSINNFSTFFIIKWTPGYKNTLILIDTH